MQQRGTNIPTDQDGEEAMRLLMARYGTDVKRLCLMILKDLYLAEDAARETFVKAWRGLEDFRGESSEKTWLMRIAVNVCRDMLRTPWMRRNDRRISAEKLLMNTPQHREGGALTEALLRLPVKNREVALLCWYQGLTVEEAAQALGISHAAATSRLHRAKEAIKRELKEVWSE